MRKKGQETVKNTTCFDVHARSKIGCDQIDCKYWHDIEEKQNCILIAAQSGEHTLQQIGNLFNITRMRVCQIEKMILSKMALKDTLKDVSEQPFEKKKRQ